jgi:hypothetical protein
LALGVVVATNELLSFDEVSHRLGLINRRYVGVRPIETDRIIGSLDRSRSFDRRFRPRRGESKRRLDGLLRAFPDGDFPPISVYEVGGAYFVSDGHHRVALARRLGQSFVDAEVTRIATSYELPSDVDVGRLMHTEQQRIFMERTGLGRARAEAVIEFSRLHGYRELLEMVNAHGYELVRARGRVMPPEEVAGDWYDNVYRPAVDQIHAGGLAEAYSYKTDADLFLWVSQVHREMIPDDPNASFADAVREASARRVGGRFRRSFLRERSSPIPMRPADAPRP